VDIWCISNLIYFKTYDDFLSVRDILLANNMDGAWSSVTAYLDWTMVGLVAMTILWGLLIICYKPLCTKRLWLQFSIAILIILGVATLNNYFIYNQKFWDKTKSIEEQEKEKLEAQEWLELLDNNLMLKSEDIPYDPRLGYIPYFNIIAAGQDRTMVPILSIKPYVQVQSILTAFFANVLFYSTCHNMQGEIINLSDKDLTTIKMYFPNDSYGQMKCSDQNIIILLVESLENWPLEDLIEGQDITPNLRLLMDANHILYCGKIKSQAMGGNSGDGQMIINSGLLPISDGAACMSYGDNVFPNIAGCFQTSSLINPWPKIWNQDTISIRYGYTRKCEPDGKQWEDKEVLDSAIIMAKESKSPFCIMAITVSTHSPFNRIRNNKVNTHAAPLMNRYLQCLNYTDSCIGAFMQEVKKDSILSQSTIVITGDHTIFKPVMLSEFKDYATQQNLSIASGDNFCPLIIYSPNIQGNIQVTDTCYQMDIYPTIMHLIGCEDYYWKGFGVNLLDSAARHNRPITEQEAYRLSDLMIRSDYFRQYHPQ